MVAAPEAPSKSARIAPKLYQTKAASIAPSLFGATSEPRQTFLSASVVITPLSRQFGQNWYERLTDPTISESAARSGRGERVRKHAEPSAGKEAVALKSDRTEAAPDVAALEVPMAPPVAQRFAGTVTPSDLAAPIILAYADPSPTAASGVLDALAAGENIDIVPDDEPLAQDDEGLPGEVPLPLGRPKVDKAEAKKAKPDKPEVKKEVDESDPENGPVVKLPREKETKVAFARPDNPAKERGGGFLSKLFGGDGQGKARDGVAVYDISAATVYMPDGTKLEAHSGIGHMADDPRYVDVKMNGPTPPHTYVLKMREKRFHGVEAIRMLPVNGKNLHGRDGFLTHSYLLRGRRAESHGCVAFKDYPKFLAAFKSGKIKKLVVVAGRGKSRGKGKDTVRVAKNGERV